jgi:tetratricopeptide (TPR) repeat protein
MSMFVLGFSLFSTPALAQEEPAEAPGTDPAGNADLERGRELFQNGKTLFEEGQYADAIVAWEEAHRLTKRPKLLFNIANAHERLGDYQQAIDVLNRYRAFAEADEKDALERRLTNLERLSEEQEADREAAQPVTPTPAPVTPPPSSGPGAGRVVGVGLIGLGAVGIVSGSVMGLSANQAGDDAKDLCVAKGDGYLCPAGATELLDQNRSRALTADLTLGAGVASAVVGTVLVLTGKGRSVAVGANRIRFSGTF